MCGVYMAKTLKPESEFLGRRHCDIWSLVSDGPARMRLGTRLRVKLSLQELPDNHEIEPLLKLGKTTLLECMI